MQNESINDLQYFSFCYINDYYRPLGWLIVRALVHEISKTAGLVDAS